MMQSKLMPWYLARARKLAVLPAIVVGVFIQTYYETWCEVMRYE